MIIVSDPDRAFRTRIVGLLGYLNNVVEADTERQVEGLVADRSDEITVVVLGPGFSTKKVHRLAATLRITVPEVSVVLITSTVTADSLQAALRSGARDVLPESFTLLQLLKAIEHAREVSQQMRERSTEAAGTNGHDHKVISVVSSKGGVGKSFVASNLAVMLARPGREVALVDLDVGSGDLALMLRLLPTRTLADAAQDLDRLDPEALRGYLTPYRPNISLLAAPAEPGLAETIPVESIPAIIGMLRQTFPVVVIDTAPTLTEDVLSAVDMSDLLVCITTMDVPSIKNLKISLQTLQLLGVERDRMLVLLNRADSKVGLELREVEKTLQTRIDATVPSSRNVPLWINRGAPIALEDPRSAVTRALQKVVNRIEGSFTTEQEEPAQRRHHLGRKR